MWLTCSSIGRKLVMAITGVALVLFVTFHCLMNSVAIFWPTAYNEICQFLGANWYALVASAGLALLFIIHIVYALWLTIQNRKARGADRYAVNSRPKQVEWASKNMLILGIVILAFLVVHMIQMWAKMQLAELLHDELTLLPELEGVPCDPVFGTIMIQKAFSMWWTPVVYIIGFVALWFHMNHGFWSMFHSAGWDNKIWISRLKTIGCIWSTVVILLFVAQAVVFTVQSHNNYYTNSYNLRHQYAQINPQYQVKYAEDLAERAEPTVQQFMQAYQGAMMQLQFGNTNALKDFVRNSGDEFKAAIMPYVKLSEGVEAAQQNQVLSTAAEILGFINHIQAQIAADDALEAAAAQTPAQPEENTEGEPQTEPTNE